MGRNIHQQVMIDAQRRLESDARHCIAMSYDDGQIREYARRYAGTDQQHLIDAEYRSLVNKIAELRA